MTDQIDQAQSYIDHTIQVGIANAIQAPQEIQSKGACHNCGESVSGGSLFCDSDCRDDWEKIRRNTKL